MDAFKVHERLIDDYKSFTEGFVDIRDERLRREVEDLSLSGRQWPDPWLSLNPSFASGGSVKDLVDDGVLHPACAEIFAAKGTGSKPRPFDLYRHQREAIDAAGDGRSYVLTTGTGSGKSLSYIVPMVDRVLRAGSGSGIKGIVVYPMNALANSQREELGKFLKLGFETPPVTFERYTGQERGDDRQAILDDPPDILLTNYVMLELMLTRPEERRFLQEHAKSLDFLVLDELHTYRGRQGADVAMLVRRLRDLTGRGSSIQCVGTSATMSSGDTVADQQQDVAQVATRVFGTTVQPADVIVETLVRATSVDAPTVEELSEAILARGPVESQTRLTYQELESDPLATWIESTFGIQEEPSSGRLVRRTPTTVDRAGAQLAALTQQTEHLCRNAIRATLLAGSAAKHPDNGRSFFAFRLHQFLSKGGSIYVTAEDPENRTITPDYQLVLAKDGQDARLYPVTFCRECGQDYLMVRMVRSEQGWQLQARHLTRPADAEDGYLFISTDREWPADPVVEGRLPQSWLATQGSNPIVQARRKDVPQRVRVFPDGTVRWPEAEGSTTSVAVGMSAAWIPGVFRFCLHCGVSYEALRTSELAKLVTLDREGRSSAMTVIASSIVRALRSAAAGDVPADAQKLLTFVDNRQDASLQAGHFNDFVQMTQLRAAIYAATKDAGPEGLDALELGRAVTQTLDLEFVDYAQVPDTLDDRPVRRALAGVVEYRAMSDLQKGQRVTLPNLEQAGLIRIGYRIAELLSRRSDLWVDSHPRLESMSPGQREEIMIVLLDEMRRVMAIDAESLTPDFVDRLRRESREHLVGVLAVGDTEPDPIIGIATPVSGQQGGARSVLNLTGRSAYGRWLRSLRTLPDLDVAEATEVIEALLRVMERHGLITAAVEQKVTGYRVKSSAITLYAADGTSGAPDPVRRAFDPDRTPRVISFFKDLYTDAGHQLQGLRAAEHTAQVRSEDREAREHAFRDARLPLLFCSPTMELGVDIASLNVVGMRNVPPTPANYAQRSGRAGRSGQQALVVTYCASGNSHDTYYFERSDQMVAGKVTPPRLDLANEDLVRSHVHAVWLAEVLSTTRVGLDSSMAQVLDLSEVGYPVRDEFVQAFADSDANQRALRVAEDLLAELKGEVSSASWWSSDWTEDVITAAPAQFDLACNRWRELYLTADTERELAEVLGADHTKSKEERREADRRRAEARQRIELLLNEADSFGQSDFYTYRYLASEGFLPGYSFPRLPLAAYIPGARRGVQGSWLQRPRFLAISEFGPNSLIYHEGARYQVTRIALPRGQGGDQGVDVVRTRLKVCEGCGYHHEVDTTVNVCEECGRELTQVWNDLLQLQTVITRRRERISADEEERNRVGYELHTTYRYMARGDHPGRARSELVTADGESLASLTYGDSAEIRVTNLGRRNRANPNLHGFWLDLVKGRWLSETKGAEKAVEEDGLEAAQQDVRAKARVTPYVQDRRNIAVVQWSAPLDDDEAITLQYALERGIEVEFQLEDSELSSESLPDAEGRGRILLIESAEGGAGVLRRLQAEPEALAAAARAALLLMHVDPDTGEDDDGSCIRGCYRCLLSYGNQLQHERIDRRLAIPRLRALLAAQAQPEELPQAVPAITDQPLLDGRAGELQRILLDSGLRTPTDVQVIREGVLVDLLFDNVTPRAAVLVEGDEPRDHHSLVFSDYNVIRVALTDDLEAIVAANPSVFGSPRTRSRS